MTIIVEKQCQTTTIPYIVAIYSLDNIITITVEIELKSGARNTYMHILGNYQIWLV
jgi:hypothetical protein